jgi:hypothetical protein
MARATAHPNHQLISSDASAEAFIRQRGRPSARRPRMALRLQPTNRSSTSQAGDSPAYQVIAGNNGVGRIYQGTGKQWVWTIYTVSAHGHNAPGGSAKSLDEARRKFKGAWHSQKCPVQ